MIYLMKNLHQARLEPARQAATFIAKRQALTIARRSSLLPFNKNYYKMTCMSSQYGRCLDSSNSHLDVEENFRVPV